MIDFNFYLITDRRQIKNSPLHEVIRHAVNGGVRAVQLRERDLSIRELLNLAGDIRDITAKRDVRLIINNRIDICLAVGADGVHLRRDSLPVEVVRRILGDKKIIGVSTHNLSEAEEAEKGGADFITLSPIYHTTSKPDLLNPSGVDIIKRIKEKISVPVFALGGIMAGNIDEVLAAGADGVAVVSSIMKAEDVEASTAMLLDKINSWRRER